MCCCWKRTVSRASRSSCPAVLAPNLTHARPARIVAAYGSPGRFLHSALAALGVQETIDLFAAEGVAVKVEETGKIFPVNNKALHVRRPAVPAATERRNAGPGRSPARTSASPARIRSDHAAVRRRRRPVRFSPLAVGLIQAAVRPATAMRSQPASDTPSSRPARPSCPSPSTPRGSPNYAASPCPTWDCGFWKGRRSYNPAGRCCSPTSGYPGRSFSTSVASSAATPLRSHSRWKWISCRTGRKRTSTSTCAWKTAAAGKKQLAAVLSVHLPRRLCEALLPQAGLTIDRKAAARQSVRSRPAGRGAVKRLRLPVAGTLGFVKAEVTAGGVARRKWIRRTMQINSRPASSSPANCWISTAPSADTIFRRRGARDGWQAVAVRE